MIAVTGAGGYVGGALLAALKGTGTEVRGWYRADGVRADESGVWCDLARLDHVEALLRQPVPLDQVVHLAGRVDIALRSDPEDASARPIPGDQRLGPLYLANVTATANLIDLCLASGARHVVFASSQAVYGLPGSERVTEADPVDPIEHYAATKCCCEEMLRVASRRGLQVTVLRFPGVYSAGRRSGLVHRLCRAALTRGHIELDLPYPLPLDVLHLDDVIEGIRLSIGRGGPSVRVYNLATGEPCSAPLLAQRIAALVPGATVAIRGAPQPALALDSSRAREELGWAPASPEERLRAMLEQVRRETLS